MVECFEKLKIMFYDGLFQQEKHMYLGMHVGRSDVPAKLLWIQRKQRIAKSYKKYRGLDILDQSIGC